MKIQVFDRDEKPQEEVFIKLEQRGDAVGVALCDSAGRVKIRGSVLSFIELDGKLVLTRHQNVNDDHCNVDLNGVIKIHELK